MLKMQMYACMSALVLAGAGLTACGGSSGAAHTNTGAATAAATASARTPASASSRLKLAPRGSASSSSAQSATSAQSTTFRTALVSFASCLRQNGVKIPAPNPSGKGPVFDTKGLDTNTPQYRAALAKCRGVIVAAFRQAASQARALRSRGQLGAPVAAAKHG